MSYLDHSHRILLYDLDLDHLGPGVDLFLNPLPRTICMFLVKPRFLNGDLPSDLEYTRGEGSITFFNGTRTSVN